MKKKLNQINYVKRIFFSEAEDGHEKNGDELVNRQKNITVQGGFFGWPSVLFCGCQSFELILFEINVMIIFKTFPKQCGLLVQI